MFPVHAFVRCNLFRKFGASIANDVSIFVSNSNISPERVQMERKLNLRLKLSLFVYNLFLPLPLSARVSPHLLATMRRSRWGVISWEQKIKLRLRCQNVFLLVFSRWLHFIRAIRRCNNVDYSTVVNGQHNFCSAIHKQFIKKIHLLNNSLSLSLPSFHLLSSIASFGTIPAFGANLECATWTSVERSEPTMFTSSRLFFQFIYRLCSSVDQHSEMH